MKRLVVLAIFLTLIMGIPSAGEDSQKERPPESQGVPRQQPGKGSALLKVQSDLQRAADTWATLRVRTYGDSELAKKNLDLTLENIRLRASLRVAVALRSKTRFSEDEAELLFLRHVLALVREDTALLKRQAASLSAPNRRSNTSIVSLLQNRNARLQKSNTNLKVQLKRLKQGLPPKSRALLDAFANPDGQKAGKKTADATKGKRAPKKPPVLTLEFSYDKFDKETSGDTREIKIPGHPGLSLKFTFYWDGKLGDTKNLPLPKRVFLIIVSLSDEWRFLETDRRLRIIVDDEKRFNLGRAYYKSDILAGDYSLTCYEFLLWSAPTELLNSLATARTVEAKVGITQFSLADKDIVAIRALLQRMHFGEKRKKTPNPRPQRDVPESEERQWQRSRSAKTAA